MKRMLHKDMQEVDCVPKITIFQESNVDVWGCNGMGIDPFGVFIVEVRSPIQCIGSIPIPNDDVLCDHTRKISERLRALAEWFESANN